MVLIRLWVIGLLFLGIGCENKNAYMASVNSASGLCTSDSDCTTGDFCRVDGTCATPQCATYLQTNPFGVTIIPSGNTTLSCSELFNPNLLLSINWISMSSGFIPVATVRPIPQQYPNISGGAIFVLGLYTETQEQQKSDCITQASSSFCCNTGNDCPVGSPICATAAMALFSQTNLCFSCTAITFYNFCLANMPNTPICNTTTGACVQCLSSTDCSGNTPVCSSTGACSPCIANTDCSGNTPVCNTTTGACTVCKANPGLCIGNTPSCNYGTGACQACTSDSCPLGTTCSSTGACTSSQSNGGGGYGGGGYGGSGYDGGPGY